MTSIRIRLITVAVAALAVVATACSNSEPATSTPVETPTATSPVFASKRVPAPIDGVTIERRGTAPLSYVAIVDSGLPNGCARFSDYAVDRDGDRIVMAVTNLMPADPNVMCTMVYGMVKNEIALPGAFVDGATYTIAVNDKEVKLVGGQAGTAAGEYRLVPAPIESIDVQILESFPVQYRVAITSGLPDACTEFDSWEVHRDGDTVRIDLRNRVPSEPMMCALVYRIEHHSIAIGNGNDFKAGSTITVQVNDRTATFTAQ